MSENKPTITPEFLSNSELKTAIRVLKAFIVPVEAAAGNLVTDMATRPHEAIRYLSRIELLSQIESTLDRRGTEIATEPPLRLRRDRHGANT
jgi:hypothetical protein